MFMGSGRDGQHCKGQWVRALLGGAGPCLVLAITIPGAGMSPCTEVHSVLTQPFLPPDTELCSK